MPKKPLKFIVDVYPIAALPLKGQQFYSYLSDTKIPRGSLVSISFFKRNIEGIAINNRQDFERFGNIHPVESSQSEDAFGVFNGVKLKKINKILEENFLTGPQLQLVEFISEYYLSPIGTALKFFVPKRVRARTIKHEPYNIKHEAKKIILTKEQQSAVKKIVAGYGLRATGFLLFGPAASGKTEVYIHSIVKLKQKNSALQFLILLPELTLTPQAIERYGQYFHTEEIVVLHSKISKGQYYSSWQKIKSGEAKIIIGTRMAVFAPFKNLGLIVVDEEQDMSFKQWDMNPRYDARTVAEKLAQLHKCPIIFGSATPRVEDYHKTETKEYKLLKLPKLKIPDTKYFSQDAKIELVDMKKERWINPPAGGYSPISKKLQSEIAYALKNKLQTILFINRQGMSNFSICAECKTVLRCPKCDRALIYDREGIYKCVHCSHKTSITPACSKCKSLAFTNIGLGTQKIEKEIHDLFPRANIARADNQTMKAPRARDILYKNFKNGSIDILIGTQMISKGWDLPSVALIGIIDGDGMLGIPDFTAEEKAFQSILQAAGRVNRPGAKFPGIVLVQTFNPGQNFFKMVAEKGYEMFYSKEIKERKNLHLPPFGKLIKLTFQAYDKNKVNRETSRIFALLEELSSKNVSLSEPQDSFLANIRGRHRKQIILKLPARAEFPEKIKNVLKSLPAGWIIDIDPIGII